MAFIRHIRCIMWRFLSLDPFVRLIECVAHLFVGVVGPVHGGNRCVPERSLLTPRSHL